MDSDSTRRVKRFHYCGALAHAFADKGQPVSVMDEPVEDCVSQGWIADGVVPMLDRELAGDDRGAATVAVFEDLQQVTPLMSCRS